MLKVSNIYTISENFIFLHGVIIIQKAETGQFQNHSLITFESGIYSVFAENVGFISQTGSQNTVKSNNFC